MLASQLYFKTKGVFFMIRIGVIGCGNQGQNHLRAIKELAPQAAEVSAISEVNEERLEGAKALWPQASVYRDYKEIFSGGGLDMVIVATMPNIHLEVTRFALKAGAHVLCEKPLALNLQEVESILETADRVGKSIQIGLQRRYWPSSLYLRELVNSGEVGKPVLAKVWGNHLKPPWWGPHYNGSLSGGGVLASTIVHSLDLAMWVGGTPNPVTVSASMGRLFPHKRGPLASAEVASSYDVEDYLTAFVRFDDGSTYFLDGNWCSEGGDAHGFELITTKGTLVNRPLSVMLDEDGSVVDRTPQIDTKDEKALAVQHQDADLITRLQNGEGWDMQDRRAILNLHKIIDACYESARSGREVLL